MSLSPSVVVFAFQIYAFRLLFSCPFHIICVNYVYGGIYLKGLYFREIYPKKKKDFYIRQCEHYMVIYQQQHGFTIFRVENVH